MCQCGHVFGLLTTSFDTTEAVKAKCRLTKCKHPPFYEEFVILARDENGYIVKGGNCKCLQVKTKLRSCNCFITNTIRSVTFALY